jgi:outer membrane lipoprotein-sorting protein
MFKNEADFEKLVSRLHIDAEPNAAHRDNLRRQMLSVFNKTSQKHITPFGVLRRSIMKSPIIKLGAAAVILIAVLIAFNPFGSSTPAFAEVVRPFLTARTATFKMTMKVEGVPPQTFDCMYAEPIRMRQTNKEQGAIVISDLQKGKIVTLVPAQKQAFVMELEDMPEDRDTGEFNMFAEIRKRVLEAQESEDTSVEFLGEQKMNGLTTIGYHVRRHGVDITVWADPQTKLPVQMENIAGPTSYTMTDIVFDVELDESLFSLEIPGGYAVRTMQVDASEPTEKDLIAMLRIWAEHMDGSLPSTLDMNATMEFVKYQQKKMKEKGQEPSEEGVLELQKTIVKMGRGAVFVQQLPAESDWHYAGKDAKLGDTTKAIFWYRPQDSATCRVIYGDLHVEDVSAETLPQ